MLRAKTVLPKVRGRASTTGGTQRVRSPHGLSQADALRGGLAVNYARS